MYINCLVSAWAGMRSVEAAYETRSWTSDAISMPEARLVSQAVAFATGSTEGKGINLPLMQLERPVL